MNRKMIYIALFLVVIIFVIYYLYFRIDKVQGLAKDAMAGAVVETNDNRVIYIAGLEAWPSNLINKQVLVRGKLVKKKYIPEPTNMSAGAEGEDWVMEEAKWTLQ